MRIKLTTLFALGTLLPATTASSHVPRKGPHRTAIWGPPRSTQTPLEASPSDHGPDRPSDPGQNQDEPSTIRSALLSRTYGWQNGWSTPISDQRGRHDQDKHNEEQTHTAPHSSNKSTLLDQQDDKSPKKPASTQHNGRPSSSSAHGSNGHNLTSSPSSIDLAQVFSSLWTKTSSTLTASSKMASLLQNHPRPPHPTLTTSSKPLLALSTASDEIYSAPTTIYETRTFTYSYLESGKKKLAITTIIGDWAIEQPAGAISTIWITKWMEYSSSSTTVPATTPSTSQTSTRSDITSVSSHQHTAKPPSRFKQSTAGQCGAFANLLTCEGTRFGPCCSQFGWCGASSMHCGDGCQADFGECDPDAEPVRMPSYPAASVTSSAATPVRVADHPVISLASTAKGSAAESLSILRPTKVSTAADADSIDHQSSSDAATPSPTGKKQKSLKEILDELRGQH